MMSRIGAFLLFVALASTDTSAQVEPPVDSLIAHYVEHGHRSNWQPHLLFTGCPDLQNWQVRGFRQLASMELSPQRMNDLGTAWIIALRDCGDVDLERWYFQRFSAAIQRGDGDAMLGFWSALSLADSPRIRDYLGSLMLDTTVSASVRNGAGGLLFQRLRPEERWQEYLRAFETGLMPDEVAWGEADWLLQRDAERLLREVTERVRRNPQLVLQTAMGQIIENAGHRPSSQGRRELAQALREAVRQSPGMPSRARQELLAAAAWLERPR